jgi:NAD(P)-dependent dehydrogenase (short-subunit alcohol dehydrogenase family)
MNFLHKHVLITGGSQGIGIDLVRSFLAAGANVTTCALEPEQPEDLAAILEQFGSTRIIYIGCDLSQPAEPAKVVAAGRERFGPVGVLVNNAANVTTKPIDRATMSDFALAFDTNVRSAWQLSISVGAEMADAGGGAIVNIGSTQSLTTRKGQFPYNVSKSAINGLTKALAVEFGDKNVRVNTVMPGIIRTRNFDNWIKQSANPAELEKKVLESHCLSRLPTLAEVSAAVLFLASDLAGGITGTELIVDGGRQAKRWG